MKFGYFLQAIKANRSGQMQALVEIRPLEETAALDAGARIIITLPVHMTAHDASLDATASAVLTAAQQLLPEPALQVWAAAWEQPLLAQPAAPQGAADRWKELTGFGKHAVD